MDTEAAQQIKDNVECARLYAGLALVDNRLGMPERVVLAHLWLHVAESDGGIARPYTEGELAQWLSMRRHALRNALSNLRRSGLVRRDYIGLDGETPVAMFGARWPTKPEEVNT